MVSITSWHQSRGRVSKNILEAELAQARLSPAKVKDNLQILLRQYGYNSTSYLAIEKDKQLFLDTSETNCTAYYEANGIALTAGEPICDRNFLPHAIDRFLQFCQQQLWQPMFFEVTEPVVPILQERGFKFLKLGEEPFFYLDEFSLKGNRMANVRSSANTARNRGVTVRRYHPWSADSVSINPQLEEISREWLLSRGLKELSFTLGSLSLDHPGDRYYFIAEQDHKVVGFLTYAPIYARSGAYLDLMRRAHNAPTGTMDLLLTESFQLLKDSGLKLATLGMSPLANVQNSAFPQSQSLAWLLHQVSQHGESFYRFNPLHEFKCKFHPHFWESKYLAYRHLGWQQIDTLLQALQHQSIRGIAWEFLNQPIHIRIF